jgi:hypothetical protein
MNRLFDAMSASNRQVGWQTFGQTFTTNINASDALTEIGGDFEIFKAPLYARINNKPVLLEGEYQLMRELGDGYVSFGRCKSAYNIMQRKDFARILDDLTLRWPLETAGHLNDGQTVFFMLNAGSIEIKGDPVSTYFLVVDTADGGTSAKAMFTGLRLRCWNALVTAMKQSIVNMSMQHRTNIQRDMSFTMDIAGKMEQSQSAMIERFDWMARKVMSPVEVYRVLEYTFPMPRRPAKMDLLEIIPEDNDDLADIRVGGENAAYAYEYGRELATTKRNATELLLERLNDEIPQLANTGWAVYNAAVELADWRPGTDSMYVDALFGQRAAEKKRAFAAVMKEL